MADVPAARQTETDTALADPLAFPEPLWSEWEDPDHFSDALALHMRRHGDFPTRLCRAISDDEITVHPDTLRRWRRKQDSPGTLRSVQILERLERRYRLPNGYFKSKLPHPSRAIKGLDLGQFPVGLRHRLAWHLPDDFATRPAAAREEILSWVQHLMFGDRSGFRGFMATTAKYSYSVRFTCRPANDFRYSRSPLDLAPTGRPKGLVAEGIVLAPPRLDQEISDLYHFHTQDLAPAGKYRRTIWNDLTAFGKVELLGRMFGALVAPADGPVRGCGVDLRSLSLASLLFPSVWDRFLAWRLDRRGFYTVSEISVLILVAALTRPESGWLWQTPELAQGLEEIPGLVSREDILRVRSDWKDACSRMHKQARTRIWELRRLVRRHRDPFEPIIPILEAANPVLEYRKITREILRLMPDETMYPREAAESVRSFLMLRFGLHLGLRQKNLRQLLLCPKGQRPRSTEQLTRLKCGELRWNDLETQWEVFIPAAAFKNGKSSYFAGERPFLQVLPQYDELYTHIEAYIERHRRQLLRTAPDPGTFFIKTVSIRSSSPVYESPSFYTAWRQAIERYGVFNPWTGRGAIEGLQPHGPHNVRDVLATHVLKKTGSYELAGYAIQSSAETVKTHYARFLPHDKAVMAAKVLDDAWRD